MKIGKNIFGRFNNMSLYLIRLRDALQACKWGGTGVVELNHRTIDLYEYHYVTYSCSKRCGVGTVEIWKHKPRFNKTSLSWKNGKSKYNDDPSESIIILSQYLDEDVNIIGTELEDCEMCLTI